MGTLWQDLRYGFRMLARSPSFTAVAVLTLALGIGANTAIFSVVNAVLLRPLPYPEPDHLVMVWNQMPNESLPQLWFSEPEFIDYRQRQQSFEDIAVFSTGGGNLTGRDKPVRVTAANVSASFFSLLRVEPTLGRAFTPEEDTPGNDRVIVLEHGFWQRYWGGDRTIIGQTVKISEDPYTIIGVMPPGFSFPDGDVDLWAPIAIDTANPNPRGSHYLWALARLKPGITFEQATADMHNIAKQMEEDHPDYYWEGRGWDTYLVPLQESFVGDVRPALLVLLGAVGFVLLIACANVISLLLARAAVREREFAIRAALGASRVRIVRQLLTESVLLALLGGGAGLLLAMWSIDFLFVFSPGSIPRLDEVGIDGRVLAFTLGISVLTGVVFGLVPALQVSKPDLHHALKEGGRGIGGSGHHRLRNLLVATEVALSLVLLIGAGLMIRSFYRLLEVNPGYRTENVLAFRLVLPSASYTKGHQVIGFYQRLLEKIRALPGVRAAGIVSSLPLSGLASSGRVDVEDMPPNMPDSPFGYFETDHRIASPGYFHAMGMTLVKGRLLKESDDAEAPLVAVVDESFVRRVWLTREDPIGKRVSAHENPDGTPVWRTIVGVVRHVKNHGLGVAGREQIYFPHAQFPSAPFGFRGMYVALRTTGDPKIATSAVRNQVASLDPDLPMFDVQTLEDRLTRSVAQPRFNVLLLGIFATVALVLAVVGLYGVISYSVSQRTHEIGIRMALGAQPRDILKLVVGQGMVITLAGVGVGLAASFALTRFLQSLLFGVSATDPVTFTAVSVLLAAVALLACYIPARRATKIDPMVALRYD